MSIAVLAVALSFGSHQALAAPSAGRALVAACLVGTWSSLDVETYSRSVFDPATSPGSIDSVAGTMRPQFGADDSFTRSFDGMVIRARMRDLAAVQTVAGDMTGHVAEDAPTRLLLPGVS